MLVNWREASGTRREHMAARWRLGLFQCKKSLRGCANACNGGARGRKALCLNPCAVMALLGHTVRVHPLATPRLTCASPAFDPSPPFLQVFVSHRFKFIYVRQPKSSSTSLLSAIQELYCNGKVRLRPCDMDTRAYLRETVSHALKPALQTVRCARRTSSRALTRTRLTMRCGRSTSCSPQSATRSHA